MDFKRLKKFDEVISCGICLEDFDEDTRCPRILSCGHTFCHSCLEKLLPEGSLCPTCKTAFNYVSVDLIPVNFFAKSILSIKKESAMSDLVSLTEMTNSSKNEFAVKSEFEKKEFTKLRCLDCNSWACSESDSLLHEHCRTVHKAEDCEDIKNEIFQKIDKELSLRESTVGTFEAILNDKHKEIEELKKTIHYLGVVNVRENEFVKKLQQIRTSVEESDSDNEFIGAMAKLEIFLRQGQRKHLAYLPDAADIKKQILMTMCLKEPCYLVINHGTDNSMYGKLAINYTGDNTIRIYGFQSEKPPKVRFIPIKYIFPTYPEQSCLSKIVFIELVVGHSSRNDFEVEFEINEGNYFATFFNNGTNIKGKSFNQKGTGRYMGNYYELSDNRNSCPQEKILTTPFDFGTAIGKWELCFIFYDFL